LVNLGVIWSCKGRNKAKSLSGAKLDTMKKANGYPSSKLLVTIFFLSNKNIILLKLFIMIFQTYPLNTFLTYKVLNAFSLEKRISL
jgi:hypothetical protein